MPKPNFLFIGPDKTGSSWLFELLRSHPQCFVPICKDVRFFDQHYERGMAWYESFFKEALAGNSAVGELSHGYLSYEPAAARIRRDLPEAKLITSLRKPAERTFSQYLYMVRSGQTRLPFLEALECFPELIDNSRYHKHLRRYFDLFPASQIKVLWFDELGRDPEKYGKECLKFLGVDPDIPYEWQKRVRPASKPRNYWLSKMVRAGAEMARSMRMENLLGRIKHSRVTRAFYSPYAPEERPVLDTDSARHLNDLFAPEIAGLERLLGVRLEHWVDTLHSGGS